ncbi:hypothetical protein CEXT_646441 [Caerostris extrusa]|uniref:Uncharacterized protein n=1 Tax=Caerostris extrusa TaxID=172846 RepID=A0AAV4M9U0_CAEEX|nr:hypothetical protein CEXT_646441 [Caerostris extrusa]
MLKELSQVPIPISKEKWKPSFGRERRKTEPAGAPARKDQKFDDLLQNGTIERTDPGFFTRSAEQHIKATIFAIKPLRQRSTNLPKHAAAFRDFHYLYPCPDIDSQQRSSNSCTTIPNSNKDDRRKSSAVRSWQPFCWNADCSNRAAVRCSTRTIEVFLEYEHNIARILILMQNFILAFAAP